MNRELAGRPRIILCDPLEYGPFIAAMKRAYLILTDSGGVQEEAPALAKPVLVLRHETERPEAVKAGVVKLVGSNFDQILRESEILLNDTRAYHAMAKGISPYGDGLAAERIAGILAHELFADQELPNAFIAQQPSEQRKPRKVPASVEARKEIGGENRWIGDNRNPAEKT